MSKKTKKKRSSRVSFEQITFAILITLVLFSISVRWIFRDDGKVYSDVPCQVAVLNGTGVNGVASAVALMLREFGVDVLIVDNADRFDYRESILIDRRGNPNLMKKLSRLTGVKQVVEQKSERSVVDATLIIGSDIYSLRIGSSIYRPEE